MDIQKVLEQVQRKGGRLMYSRWIRLLDMVIRALSLIRQEMLDIDRQLQEGLEIDDDNYDD